MTCPLSLQAETPPLHTGHMVFDHLDNKTLPTYTMCRFIQMQYTCAHVALATHGSTTFHCDKAFNFRLVDGCDGPTAFCFPHAKDVTDPYSVKLYHDLHFDCHFCKGRTRLVPDLVYAHIWRRIRIRVNNDMRGVGICTAR